MSVIGIREVLHMRRRMCRIDPMETTEQTTDFPAVGSRVFIDSQSHGMGIGYPGTVQQLSVRGWPQGWALVLIDGCLRSTVAPINRLHPTSIRDQHHASA